MKKRSDREEYRLNLFIFFGVIISSFFIINFLTENYIAPLTGNVIDRDASINPVIGPIVKVCSGLVCPTGYTKSDTDGDGCPDTCSGGIVSPVTCPYHEACLVGYTLTDTNGDGCFDSCVSIAPPASCVEDWTCTTWSLCTNGSQNRTCTDRNLCGTENNKPNRENFCNVAQGTPNQTAADTTIQLCVEDWQCSKFTACVNSEQSRSCLDNNKCGTIFDKPGEKQTCVEETQTAAVPDQTAVTGNTQTVPETTESSATAAGVNTDTNANANTQQPASQNNSAFVFIILAILLAAIGGATYFIIQMMKRKKLVGQLDEVLKRASSALATGDLKGASSNYSVLREYYSTYQNKIPKKDAARFSGEALKVYNELTAKQKAVASQIA